MRRMNERPFHVLRKLVKFDSLCWRIHAKLVEEKFASSQPPRQNFLYLSGLFRYTEVVGCFAQNFPSMPGSMTERPEQL